jgi:hypothetical protein
LLVDRLLGTERFVVPYAAAGVIDDGRQLLQIWDEIQNDPAHDCILVDRWAHKLGMSAWYRWIPYKP